MEDIYVKLARHMNRLVMGYPYNDALPGLLQAMFSPQEARTALAIPSSLAPLEAATAAEIARRAGLPLEETAQALEGMARRRVIYSGPAPDGSMGYALLQMGFGLPQTFFWGGRTDDHAKEMAKQVMKYFTVPVTGEVYGGVKTKTYKYSPAALSVDIPMQEVHPNEQMESIVGAVDKAAVAHCPCRVSARLLGRTDCTHSLEVCLKYDDMAEFVVSRGMARAISKDEALDILRKAEQEGLVHMTDNAQEGHKHTCNCCGHYCWNVGVINRRRIPRDQLMAVYFIRETAEDECLGCGACADICPVNAVSMESGVAVVDRDWCIGCGVCALKCPAGIISIRRRDPVRPPKDFGKLIDNIRRERGLDEKGRPGGAGG